MYPLLRPLVSPSSILNPPVRVGVYKRKSKHPTPSNLLQRNSPYDTSSAKVGRLNSLLVDLVCKQCLPMSLVESDALRAFVHEPDPRYILPSRKSLSNDLIVVSNTKQDTIKDTLIQSSFHTLTTDMWTSASNDAYMGVTTHWLGPDFTPFNRCLAVKPAPGSHTADFLSAELNSVMDEWGIASDSVHMVTDSGANITKAVSQMPNVKWRPCFAHTLSCA